MSNDEEWVSISAIGDPWEVEMNVMTDQNSRNRYRYRTANLGRYRTEWESGRPPTGVHAEPKTFGKLLDRAEPTELDAKEIGLSWELSDMTRKEIEEIERNIKSAHLNARNILLD